LIRKTAEETHGEVSVKNVETHCKVRDYLPAKESLVKGKMEKNEENRKNTEKVVDS